MLPPPETGDLISTLIVSIPSQDFLFYYEKYLHLSEHDQKIVYADRFSRRRRDPPLISVFFSSPPKGWDPFVKQTYSAWVDTANGKENGTLVSMVPPFLLLFQCSPSQSGVLLHPANGGSARDH